MDRYHAESDDSGAPSDAPRRAPNIPPAPAITPDQLVKALVTMTEEDPDGVAKLVKGWLKE